MDQSKLTKQRMTFAAFLQDARQKRRTSREQVAQKLGIAEDVVERWESGDRLIDVVELAAYCKAIGFPVEEAVAFLQDISDD